MLDLRKKSDVKFPYPSFEEFFDFITSGHPSINAELVQLPFDLKGRKFRELGEDEKNQVRWAEYSYYTSYSILLDSLNKNIGYSGTWYAVWIKENWRKSNLWNK